MWERFLLSSNSDSWHELFWRDFNHRWLNKLIKILSLLISSSIVEEITKEWKTAESEVPRKWDRQTLLRYSLSLFSQSSSMSSHILLRYSLIYSTTILLTTSTYHIPLTTLCFHCIITSMFIIICFAYTRYYITIFLSYI